MKKWLITMSGARYDRTTALIVNAGPSCGADEVLVYDDRWVADHEFRKLNAWLWDHPGDKNGKRGFGWYAWKPLLLIDALDRAADGDVVLYIDADTYPVASMQPIYDIAARSGAFLISSIGHKQATWCKGDCYVAMGQDVIDAPAGCARFVAIRKGGWKERQFLWEWLTYAVNPTATTFDPSRFSRDPQGFEEHRTEQAIMTNLAHRYGYKLWRECDDSGEGWDVDRDALPVPIFQQVRQGGGNVDGGSRWRNV